MNIKFIPVGIVAALSIFSAPAIAGESTSCVQALSSAYNATADLALATDLGVRYNNSGLDGLSYRNKSNYYQKFDAVSLGTNAVKQFCSVGVTVKMMKLSVYEMKRSNLYVQRDQAGETGIDVGETIIDPMGRLEALGRR